MKKRLTYLVYNDNAGNNIELWVWLQMVLEYHLNF